MLKEQNELCYLCGQRERMERRGKPVPLMVDHNHTTGRVRRLICNTCNKRVEWLEGDVGQRYLAYLQDFA